MGDSIIPISTSVPGLTPDRQPRRDQRNQSESDEAKAVAVQSEDNRSEPRAPVADEPAVVAETLFSASVLGQRMRSMAADLQALKLQREQDWAPPESALRLKDKSI